MLDGAPCDGVPELALPLEPARPPDVGPLLPLDAPVVPPKDPAVAKEPDAVEDPEGEPEVGAPDLRPVFEDFPGWLGGMTQDEAGLTVNLVAVA
ncbi:MAG TPA: hypothetical protein VGY54_14655 [Polyangiaceae bacterium]|nr:hypothetical protein [Polyangiaceae bacterium]